MRAELKAEITKPFYRKYCQISTRDRTHTREPDHASTGTVQTVNLRFLRAAVKQQLKPNAEWRGQGQHHGQHPPASCLSQWVGCLYSRRCAHQAITAAQSLGQRRMNRAQA